LSSLAGVSYLERVALAGPRHHMKARQAVRKALRCQMEGRGFSLVEVLSACPTGWKKTPADAWHWIEEQMLPVFPLGVFKEPPKTETASRAWPVPANAEQVVPLLDLPLERTGDRLQNRLALNECYSGIKIAGFGGQGVLSLGIILATAGMKEGYRTSWLPSYGPEMRGGTAHCHVILSDQEIGTPLVDSPDILIAMNGPSLTAFQPHVRSGGLIVYDSSRVTRPLDSSQSNSIGIPASQIAQELGNPRVANLVALGAVLSRQKLMEHQPLLRREAIWQAIDEMVAQDPLRQLNRKALECGERLGLS
jgi:2-oxoisovalerate ferredoxin oxidoreductase beta subunit